MTGKIERRSIAAQLAAAIEKEIREGVWQKELPGKRTLSKRFEVNEKTCVAAMELLEERGVLGPGIAGRGRKILTSPVRVRKREKKRDQRLLLIHRLEPVLNHDDWKLLHGMGEIWAESRGEVVWATVDYPRCKNPGAILDELIRRHAPHALMLHMSWMGWDVAAAKRLPTYRAGGMATQHQITTSASCSNQRETERAMTIFRELGHERILFPTVGFDEAMRLGLVKVMKEHGCAMPKSGDWNDCCPSFREETPEVWEAYWERAFRKTEATALITFEDTLLMSIYSYCSLRGIRIPNDLSVMLLNYDSLFQYMRPRPTMFSYPMKAALAHFRQWVDGGLKATGKKIFDLELIEGQSLGRRR